MEKKHPFVFNYTHTPSLQLTIPLPHRLCKCAFPSVNVCVHVCVYHVNRPASLCDTVSAELYQTQLLRFFISASFPPDKHLSSPDSLLVGLLTPEHLFQASLQVNSFSLLHTCSAWCVWCCIKGAVHSKIKIMDVYSYILSCLSV